MTLAKALSVLTSKLIHSAPFLSIVKRASGIFIAHQRRRACDLGTYRQAAALLEELLPETGGLNYATTRNRTLAVDKRIEEEIRWKEILEELVQADDFAKLTRKYRRDTQQREATVLLVIDQFEELLGHARDYPANRFLTLLRATLEAQGTPLLVLATRAFK